MERARPQLRHLLAPARDSLGDREHALRAGSISTPSIWATENSEKVDEATGPWKVTRPAWRRKARCSAVMSEIADEDLRAASHEPVVDARQEMQRAEPPRCRPDRRDLAIGEHRVQVFEALLDRPA
jgi:hypothetical protein